MEERIESGRSFFVVVPVLLCGTGPLRLFVLLYGLLNQATKNAYSYASLARYCVNEFIYIPYDSYGVSFVCAESLISLDTEALVQRCLYPVVFVRSIRAVCVEIRQRRWTAGDGCNRVILAS
jgi:hypothetical protein